MRMHKVLIDGFRADINGLRAWAVIFVVLYHFGLLGVSGGFAGVDVFFVISGFLMTGVVLKGLRSGRFQLWQFYLARARRIWPALIVLCMVLLALGWFILMPYEYQTLGKHARDSLLFSSNLRYLEEAGYFDLGANQKWLLHTWSLSVEWQFYLVFPLIMAALWKLFPRERIFYLALGVMLCVSLAWSVWLSVFEAQQAFFILSSRGWELLAGGLVFCMSEKLAFSLRQRRLMLLGGFLLLFVPMFALDSNVLWPGGWALLPVLATALLILAQTQNNPLLHAVPLQWIGSRSYSLYLWHWPLVVGLAFVGLQDSLFWLVAGILMALALAHISYRWVEEPARRLLTRRNGWPLVGSLVGLLLLGVSAAQVIRKSDFPERLPPAVAQMAAQAGSPEAREETCSNEETECLVGGSSIRGIVLGDSHAGALVEAINDSLMDKTQGIYMRARAGCLLVFGARQTEGGEECSDLQAWVRDSLPGLYPGVPVLLVMRTTAYVKGGLPGEQGQAVNKPKYYFSVPYDYPAPEFLDEFRRHYVDTVCAIASHHPLYILRPTPELGVNVPLAMARDLLLGREHHYRLSLAEYRKRHAFIWRVQDEASAQCGAKVLDPLPYLCAEGVCPAASDGKPLYYDDDHLGEVGSARLKPLFRQVLGGT